MAPMRLRRPAAAVLGLLALLPTLAACGDGSTVEVGDIVDARADDQFVGGGQASSITLPIGRLEISAGKPTTSLSADDTAQLEPVEAPEGSAFVPITWQYDAGTFGDYAEYMQTDGTPVIDLVADRASYRIPSPETSGEGAESFYVLVSGSGEDASLAVEYDGVSQSVDLATGERDEGDAAALYDLKRTKVRTRSCTNRGEFALTSLERMRDFSCSVTTPIRLPYAGGEWAAPGQSWTAVTVSTTVRRYDRTAEDFKSGALYVATSVTSTFKLGALKPAKVIKDRGLTLCPDETQGGCSTVYHLVFAVGDGDKLGRLRVNQTYGLDRVTVWGGGDGPASVDLKGTLSIPLR